MQAAPGPAVAGAGPDGPDRLAGADPLTNPDQSVDRLVGRAQVAVVDRDYSAPGERSDERHPTVPGGAHPLPLRGPQVHPAVTGQPPLHSGDRTGAPPSRE